MSDQLSLITRLGQTWILNENTDYEKLFPSNAKSCVFKRISSILSDFTLILCFSLFFKFDSMFWVFFKL